MVEALALWQELYFLMAALYAAISESSLDELDDDDGLDGLDPQSLRVGFGGSCLSLFWLSLIFP